MASVRDDDYSRLAQSVDDWLAELNQARTVLAQTMAVRQSRPAFKITGSDPVPIAVEPPPKVEPVDAGDDDARISLLARVAESEREAREAQHLLCRVQSELDFAREQLHLQNRLRAELEEKWAASEREREATVHALGHAQITLDEMRRQLRGKEWALENAMSDLEEGLDSGPASPQSIEELKREAAELQSRLDALTVELGNAREQAKREQELAAAAEERRENLEREASKSREIVEELSRDVQRYADELRETGRELDEARLALARRGTGAHADAEAKSSIDEARLALQNAERRNDELAAALAESERAAHERLSEAVAEGAVLQDNFDALAASHMDLREHVTTLQSEMVARDHELAHLRAGIAASKSTSPDGRDVMNTELEGTVEDLESDATSDAYLVQALRRELAAARESLEQTQLDQRLLTRALRGEIEGLRAMAAERDFVIHHQSAQLDATLLEEGPGPATSQGHDIDAVNEELSLLRQRLADKDAIVSRLRAQLAESQAWADSAESSEAQELRAIVRHREADLERTRDRVAFLRRALRDAQFEKDSKQAETEASAAQNHGNTPENTTKKVKQPETTTQRPVRVDPDIDLSRYQANASLQREVERTLALQSAWPILAITTGLAGCGLLALAVLALLLI